MVEREILKDLLIWKDDNGNVTSQKGTRCTLIRDGETKVVEKEWVSGDWLFTAEYQYAVEKNLYEQCHALGLSVPRLIDSDDKKKILLLEYIEGPKLKPPCQDLNHLLPILTFFDCYKDIQLDLLWPITKEQIAQYNFRCIQHAISDEEVCQRVDQIFRSFFDEAPLLTIPFDAILKNIIQGDDRLYFIDFEWSIAGPYELVLARLASEFNVYDNDLILGSVEELALYHVCLLRFYMQGRWPEVAYPYLRDCIESPDLKELFRLINVYKYADEAWCG